LYVKASKAAEADEDPAGAERARQATEQRLLVAILAGQLALADIRESQAPGQIHPADLWRCTESTPRAIIISSLRLAALRSVLSQELTLELTTLRESF
jgi:hypothetical protein